MKSRRISYWIGLLCLAVLVLMPDITVNAQPDPGGQGSDTQTSEGQQPPEEPQPPAVQAPSNQSPALPPPSTTKFNEQFLIQGGCQFVSVIEDPVWDPSELYTVWNRYTCAPGTLGSPHGGFWNCLATPETLPTSTGSIGIKRGDCHGVYAAIREGDSTENGQSPREINVKKIVEPASSDSQGESDQQQTNGNEVAQVDEEEAQGEEAGGEENNASNQSQENDNSKQGYGCSANP